MTADSAIGTVIFCKGSNASRSGMGARALHETSVSVLGHEVEDGLLQTVQGQLEHGKDLADDADSPGQLPLLLADGVEPHGVTEGPGEELESVDACPRGLLVHVDGAVAVDEFVGGHAGVADDDEARLRIAADKLLHRLGLEIPPGVRPDAAVDRVVEKEDLQILELGTGVVKQGLNDTYVRIHGPAAVIDHEDDLQAVRGSSTRRQVLSSPSPTTLCRTT